MADWLTTPSGEKARASSVSEPSPKPSRWPAHQESVLA